MSHYLSAICYKANEREAEGNNLMKIGFAL